MKKAFFTLLFFASVGLVARAGDADLSALAFSIGTLQPVFNSSTLDYTIQVSKKDADGNDIKSIAITPTAVNAAATIIIYSKIVPSGTQSPAIPVNPGADKITVTVQKGAAKNVYTIKVSMYGAAGFTKMASPDHFARIGPEESKYHSRTNFCFEWTAGYYKKDTKGNNVFQEAPLLDPDLTKKPSKDFPTDKQKHQKDDRQIEVNPSQTTVYQLALKPTTSPNNGIENYCVTVYSFAVEFFRHDKQKEWKVVAGDKAPIEYSAVAVTGCTNWEWKLGDGAKWTLQNNTKQTGKDMFIPYADLAKASNEWFGDAFGTVTVTCTDPDGKTVHTVTSTKADPTRKAKIFFDPELNEDGEESLTETKPPCWFKFWKEGNVIEDLSHDFVAFAVGDGGSECGKYEGDFDGSKITEKLILFRHAFYPHSDIQTLTAAGKDYAYNGNGTYLKGVAEVLAHEWYHRYAGITWSYVIPKPTDTDKDGIPDNEEANTVYNGADIFPKTLPDKSDSYDLLKKESGEFPMKEYENNTDEELRCRIVSVASPKKTNPEKDWAKHDLNPHWAD